MTQTMQTPFEEQVPRFRQMAAEAGRDPDSLSVNLWGRQPDYDELARYRDMGVDRVCTSLECDPEERILPLLDRWAEVIRRLER